MPKYVPDKEKMNEAIKLRVNEDIRHYIDRVAYEDGMTVSEYIRRLIIADAYENGENLEDKG